MKNFSFYDHMRLLKSFCYLGDSLNAHGASGSSDDRKNKRVGCDKERIQELLHRRKLCSAEIREYLDSITERFLDAPWLLLLVIFFVYY